MRRGITPVVAIALLLGMTVAASGGAYAWVSQIQDTAAEEADTVGAARLVMKDVACATHEVSVSVSNTGDVTLQDRSATVYVYQGGDLSATADINLSAADFRNPGGFETVTAGLSDNISASREYDVELRAADSGTTAAGRCRASYPASCLSIQDSVLDAGNGTYTVEPGIDVRCDMDTAGGGWTLIAASADAGGDDWTWNNRDLLTGNETTFGTLSDLNATSHEFGDNYKSLALHRVYLSDVMLRWSGPSASQWAYYTDVAAGNISFDTLVSRHPTASSNEVACVPHDEGYAMTGGNLVTQSSGGSGICESPQGGATLYFNSPDADGVCTGDGTYHNDYVGPSVSHARNSVDCSSVPAQGTGQLSDEPGWVTMGMDRHVPDLQRNNMDDYTNTLPSGVNTFTIYVR